MSLLPLLTTLGWTQQAVRTQPTTGPTEAQSDCYTREPRWAPDGDLYLASSRVKGPSPVGHSDSVLIAACSPDGDIVDVFPFKGANGRKPWIGRRASRLQWSPADSDKVLVGISSIQRGKVPSSEYYLWTVGEPQLQTIGRARSATWAPDGQSLLIGTHLGYDLYDSQAGFLNKLGGCTSYGHPTGVSIQGEWLVAYGCRDAKRVRLFDWDGVLHGSVSKRRFGKRPPRVSPDGRMFAGNGWIITTNGSEVTEVGEWKQYHWSPNSKFLVCVTGDSSNVFTRTGDELGELPRSLWPAVTGRERPG